VIQPPLNNVPILGQQQEQATAGIVHAVQALSLGIYSRVVVPFVASQDATTAEKSARMQQLAWDSMTAAKAYFEGLGIANSSRRRARPWPRELRTHGSFR